jgi:hypothetical protein
MTAATTTTTALYHFSFSIPSTVLTSKQFFPRSGRQAHTHTHIQTIIKRRRQEQSEREREDKKIKRDNSHLAKIHDDNVKLIAL